MRNIFLVFYAAEDHNHDRKDGTGYVNTKKHVTGMPYLLCLHHLTLSAKSCFWAVPFVPFIVRLEPHIRAPGKKCSVIHVLISALYKLFVCVFTSFLSFFLINQSAVI